MAKLKSKDPAKYRYSLTKLPYAITIFVAMLIIVLVSFGAVTFFYNNFFSYYIKQDCDKRLDNAINSCQNLAVAYQDSMPTDSVVADEYFINSLLHSIVSSADVSTDANIVLFKTVDDDTEILWPSDAFSYFFNSKTKKITEAIMDDNPVARSNTTYLLSLENTTYYYRIQDIDYRDANDEVHKLTDYHICVYVDSSHYYSFMESFNYAMWQLIIVAIIAAAIISIIVSMPLILSTIKLSRFSKRISEGNYNRLKGRLISREMYDLADTMNSMAEKLEESEKEQQTFFQNASHELRTPLQSIQGYAEGLKYDVFDEEGKQKAVDIIIDESSRLTGMVENLLSISKMDMSSKGNYKVKKQNLSSKVLCDLVVENIRGNVLLADKELILDFSSEDASIYANSGDLLRMFENLFSNCLRYCKENVIFKYRIEGDQAAFYVMDDGVGISDEVLSHLFARFAKGSDGKHGIGLALCKAIVEEHNGTIRGYNIPEGGACFEVRLPVKRTDSEKIGGSYNPLINGDIPSPFEV